MRQRGRKPTVHATRPKHPSPGETALLCVHGPDVRQAHYFYFPAEDGRDCLHFTRPDGSTGKPARWILMCEDCFEIYCNFPIACPCSSDIEWPDDLTVTINAASRPPN